MQRKVLRFDRKEILAMKKLGFALVLLLLFGCVGGAVSNTTTEAKTKNYYFAGRYKKVYKDKSYAILKMSQYSSDDEGKIKGNFSLDFTSFSGRGGSCVRGKLKKIGKNKYRYKVDKVVFTFKVYSKKVVIKQRGTSFNYGINENFSGTYKLKKRYYS